MSYGVELKFGSEKEVGTTKFERKLGTRGWLPDGRVYRWSVNGATEIVAHRLVQAKVVGGGIHSANLTMDTVLAGGNTLAAGGTSVGITWLTTPHTSGEYVDGWLVVETTPGEGMYAVKADDDAADSGATSTLVLEEGDQLKVALTTVSKIAMIPNPYSSVIIAPVALTNQVVGITPVTVPADNYFWLQTYGPAAVKYDTATAAVLGSNVIPGVTSAGDVVGVFNTTASGSDSAWKARSHAPVVGWVMTQTIPGEGDMITIMMTLLP